MKSYPTSFKALTAVAVLWLVTAAPARATLIVSGTDQNVAVGGTADISFFVSSISGDSLASFGLQLQITGVTGELQFSASQPVSQLSDPNYVFYNNSLAASVPPFWNPSFASDYPNDTITGGDTYTGSSGAATLTPLTSYLLATVTVYANPSLVAAGDSFQVALVPPSVGDPNRTNFMDPNSSLITYTSTPVTVLVVPAGMNPVPEPPSLVLLAGIGASLGLLCYWRRRTTATPRLIAGS